MSTDSLDTFFNTPKQQEGNTFISRNTDVAILRLPLILQGIISPQGASYTATPIH